MKRLFFDMDGTLAVFSPILDESELYVEGKFLNQLPQENLISAVKALLLEGLDNIYILSAYLLDSPYALNEKNQWLDQFLPELPASHRIFVPVGTDKKAALSGGISKDDILLDDYSVNLHDWNTVGTGVKFLNGINHTKGTWQGEMISCDATTEELKAELSQLLCKA